MHPHTPSQYVQKLHIASEEMFYVQKLNDIYFFTLSRKHFFYFLLTFTLRVTELRGGDGTVQVS